MRASSGGDGARPSIREVPALRRASKVAIDLFDPFVASLTAATAGLVSTRAFGTVVVEPTAEIAHRSSNRSSRRRAG